MKKMFLAFAAILLSPWTASAGTVFDDAQSFDVAKVTKLGRETYVPILTITPEVNMESSGQYQFDTIKCQATDDLYGERGEYESGSGTSRKCLPCPDNAICDGSSTIYCKPGYKYNSGTPGSCSICAAGSYQAGNNGGKHRNTSCNLCSTGYYVGTSGATACTAASKGYCSKSTSKNECAGANSTGSTAQMACPKGTYTSSAGNASCSTPSTGYCATTGEGKNQACIGNATGATGQMACAAGYVPTDSKTVCSACGQGTYANVADSCTKATAGYCAANSDGDCVKTAASQQVICAIGTFSVYYDNNNDYHATGTDGGGSYCLAVPVGYAAVDSNGSYHGYKTGAYNMTQCPAGTCAGTGPSGGEYCMYFLGTTCLTCPRHTYSAAGSAYCTSCAEGEFAEAGSSSCSSIRTAVSGLCDSGYEVACSGNRCYCRQSY